jgi:hypothetical protein
MVHGQNLWSGGRQKLLNIARLGNEIGKEKARAKQEARDFLEAMPAGCEWLNGHLCERITEAQGTYRTWALLRQVAKMEGRQFSRESGERRRYLLEGGGTRSRVLFREQIA